MTAAAITAQTVTCDECGDIFAHQGNAYVEREGDIEHVGLQCPHCETRFPAYRTNSEIRKLQELVRAETVLFRKKVAAGVPPSKAERKLKRARRRLERAFKAFNEGDNDA